MTLINKTIAQYEVISKIGEGGIGEVYRARDTKLSRDVAIKVLPAAFSAGPGSELCDGTSVVWRNAYR